MMMVSVMVLVFWLVLLFLDGALSSRIPYQGSTSSLSSLVSLEDVLLEGEEEENEILSHAVASAIDVDTMVQETLHHHVWNAEAFNDLGMLEYLYTQHKNPDLLHPMIEKFLQYYQFEKANTYLTILVEKAWSYVDVNVDPHKVLYIRFHDFGLSLDRNNALDSLLDLVKTYRQRSLMNYDDELFYKGLQLLWTYNYDAATQTFAKIVDVRYKDFILAYESALANYVKIKDPPPYYRDGLVALTLLKHGYFSVAKRLALRAVAQNSSYVLPYQVLAYTNFLTHNREAAKQYFLTLTKIDSQYVAMYRFLIGVSHYRIGEYQQSILYLNQVVDPALQTDAYRYMLLGYVHINDTTNVLRMFHNLLGQPGLQSSDFVIFFDQIFYIPFRLGQSFALYRDAPQLAELYLSRCSTLFDASQADVCVYGEVWLQLVKQNLSLVWTKLLSLTQTYQQSHLYHVLGDYYAELWQTTLAREAYVRALSISESLAEQKLIKEKMSK